MNCFVFAWTYPQSRSSILRSPAVRTGSSPVNARVSRRSASATNHSLRESFRSRRSACRTAAFQPGNGVAEFLPTFGQTQQSICATALFDRFPIGGNASCRSAFLRGGYGLFDKGILFQTNEFLLQRGTGSLDFTQFGSIERAPPFRDEIIAQDELCAQLVDTFPGFLQPVPDFEKLSTHSLLFLRGFFLEFRPD